MNEASEFFTLTGYQRNEISDLSPAMEDYLEMICRLLSENEVVRINELSEKLNVKPSSASKMVRTLRDSGYLKFHSYGYIGITEKGQIEGDYLLYRHKVLHSFLCMLNGTDNELEQVEKIEHFINRYTVDNIQKLMKQINKIN